uniref:Uncharacterized protein n=1 Tax=Hucho hucho TaxID=62062 RepID=A0A4W5KB06_9TELE
IILRCVFGREWQTKPFKWPWCSISKIVKQKKQRGQIPLGGTALSSDAITIKPEQHGSQYPSTVTWEMMRSHEWGKGKHMDPPSFVSLSSKAIKSCAFSRGETPG